MSSVGDSWLLNESNKKSIYFHLVNNRTNFICIHHHNYEILLNSLFFMVKCVSIEETKYAPRIWVPDFMQNSILVVTGKLRNAAILTSRNMGSVT